MTKENSFKAITHKKTVGIFKWALFLFCSIALVTFLLAVLTLVFGRKLDAYFGTGYWITLFIGLLGLVIVLALTLAVALRTARGIREIMDENKKTEEDLDRNH